MGTLKSIKNTRRCDICDYCGFDDKFEHDHFRSFFLDKKTDRYICNRCADAIGDALKEFDHEHKDEQTG